MEVKPAWTFRNLRKPSVAYCSGGSRRGGGRPADGGAGPAGHGLAGSQTIKMSKNDGAGRAERTDPAAKLFPETSADPTTFGNVPAQGAPILILRSLI
jgi:hypothetical protein